MNANEHELILKEEVYKIVGAAMEVSNELGAGFLEGAPKLEWKRMVLTQHNIRAHSRPFVVEEEGGEP